MSENKCLRLYTGTWGSPEYYTFKALPTTRDAGFLEIIYDADARKLAVIGTFVKKGFTMLQKLDKFGQPVHTPEFKQATAKFGSIEKAAAAASEFGVYPYVKERVEIDNVNEYIISDPTEIMDFINRFCENAGTYDFKKFMNSELQMVPEPVNTPQVEVQETATTQPESKLSVVSEEEK